MIVNLKPITNKVTPEESKIDMNMILTFQALDSNAISDIAESESEICFLYNFTVTPIPAYAVNKKYV